MMAFDALLKKPVARPKVKAKKEITPVCEIVAAIASQDYSTVTPVQFLLIFELIHSINSTNIDLGKLKSLYKSGIPEQCKALRSFIWRLILGFLPTNAKEWKSHMEKQRKQYDSFVKEFFVPLSHPVLEKQEQGDSEGESTAITDAEGHYVPFLSGRNLSDQIQCDVRRTMYESGFIFAPTLASRAAGKSEPRAEAIYRMLSLYATLNPGVKYVQGMNEILAVVFFTIEEGCVKGLEGFIESDTFFTFTLLMGELINNFLRTLDKTVLGILVQMQKLSAIVKRFNSKLWTKLKSMEIEYQYFALRWVLLLFCQEFEIKETQELWDMLLCDPRRFDQALYVSAVLILNLEKVIMAGDFSEVMQSLQSAQKYIPLAKIKALAEELYNKDQKHTKR